MYGYNDYHGPSSRNFHVDKCASSIVVDDDDDDDENDPLRPGLWMEGDSLAPPCGCSVAVIHEMLSLANVSEEDVLYDLGAGDGRVCLEAFFTCNCRYSIGVEIEWALVERFQVLIDQTLATSPPTSKDHELSQTSNSAAKLSSNLMVSVLPRIFALEGDLRTVLNCLLHRHSNTTRIGQRVSPITASEKNATNTIPEQVAALLLDPTVITIYLLPEAIKEVEPLVIELLRQTKGKDGSNLRIVCNTWGFRTIQPYKIKDVEGTRLLLYTCQSLSTVM